MPLLRIVLRQANAATTVCILVRKNAIVINLTPVAVPLLRHLRLRQETPVEGLVVTVVPHQVVLMIVLP